MMTWKKQIKKKKSSEFIFSLPQSSSALAMVTYATKTSFNNIAEAAES